MCRDGQVWDETRLECLCPRGTAFHNSGCKPVQQCRNGQVWNPNTWECKCEPPTVFNGIYCISNPCQNGRVWNDDPDVRACVCPEKKIWDSRACVPPRIDCTNGRVWDPTIYACACPVGTFPNINKCDPIPMCKNGQQYNPLNNKCECPFSLIYQN